MAGVAGSKPGVVATVFYFFKKRESERESGRGCCLGQTATGRQTARQRADRGRRGGALRGAALCSTEAHRDADKETAEGFKALSGMGGESKEVEMEPGTPSKVRSRCVSVPRCLGASLSASLCPSPPPLSVCLALGLPLCLCLSPPPCVSSPTLSVVCVCRRRGRRRRKFHRPPRKRPSCSRPPPR